LACDGGLTLKRTDQRSGFMSLYLKVKRFEIRILLENENKSDSRVFWITSYATPFLWCLFIIVSVLSFSLSNITICLFGFVLSFTNLSAYIRCEKSHKAKLKNFIFQQAQEKLTV
jgi:hypothetical protein